MPVYISSLIIVSAFFMFVQSIFFIAYRKYKTLLLLLVHACTYCLPYNTPILKSLHWLPVKYCINFKLCCITHRTLSLGEIHYLNSLLILRLNSHSFCSFSFYPLLSLFFNEMSNGFCSFAYTAPFFWNYVLNTVHSAPTHLSFKKNFKTYF